MNLVMGTALGYNAEQLRPFVHSLRKHFDGLIGLLVQNPTEDVEKLFYEYDVKYFNTSFDTNNQDAICSKRHVFYKQILLKSFPNVEKILLTDVRDVVFQDDPFVHEMTKDLEFFYETKLYRFCECHRHWFEDLNIYGRERFNQIKDNYIICAGTSFGTKVGMYEYLNKMNTELERMQSVLGRPITDQPTHAHLIYSNAFSNYRCFHTGGGPVATLNGVTDIEFDENDNMLNDDGSIVAVVHQWDRTQYADKFKEKALS